MKKKMIAVICLVIAMTTLLTACGKFKCDLCDKEFDRKEKSFYKTDEGKWNLCQDCYEKVEQLEDEEAVALLKG